VAAETVGRAAPGCGEVEGNEVGRGRELGERPGSGGSGHIGLASPVAVGWGWGAGRVGILAARGQPRTGSGCRLLRPGRGRAGE